MRTHAVDVTNLRRMFNKKAEEMELEDDNEEQQPVLARSRKGLKHSRKHEKPHHCNTNEYMSLNAFGSFPTGRYKKRKLKQLTSDHLTDILHAYLIDFKS